MQNNCKTKVSSRILQVYLRLHSQLTPVMTTFGTYMMPQNRCTAIGTGMHMGSLRFYVCPPFVSPGF